MKHTYQRPAIQVVHIANEHLMEFRSGFHVTNVDDLTEYKGPVIEKMDPSAGGPTADWSEEIWGRAD